MTPYRVLLVDDHPRLRQLYRIAISAEPQLRVVAEAGDGDEGARLARQHAPDLVVLDLSMPHRDGLQTLQEIKHALPHARVVVLSGFTRDRVEGLVLDMGANAYVEKGLRATEIAPTLLRVAREAPAAPKVHHTMDELEARVRALV